jgi:hypothetical protein
VCPAAYNFAGSPTHYDDEENEKAHVDMSAAGHGLRAPGEIRGQFGPV